MEITNHREVRLSVPSLHIDVAPGETVTVPDGTSVPHGFTGPDLPPAPKPPTKPELLERAAALGVTVPSGATKAQILDLLDTANQQPDQTPEPEAETEPKADDETTEPQAETEETSPAPDQE